MTRFLRRHFMAESLILAASRVKRLKMDVQQLRSRDYGKQREFSEKSGRMNLPIDLESFARRRRSSDRLERLTIGTVSTMGVYSCRQYRHHSESFYPGL